MLKKLRSGLFYTQVQKQLDKARIDRTHYFIQPKHISQIICLIYNPKQKNQLLNLVYKGINSSQQTLKIKSLIILHACIRKSFEDDICEIAMNQEVEQKMENISKSDKLSLQSYINKNVINFYVIYLKKVCMHKESFLFLKRFNKERLKTQLETETEQDIHRKNLQIVHHGFKILNLINYILQSQEMFNKMGRYHIQYEEILNIYMQLLEDIDIFNSFLKASVKEIIDRNKKQLAGCQNSSNKIVQLTDISLNKPKRDFAEGKKDKLGTSSTKEDSSTITIANDTTNLSSEEVQEIKHYFLYINQSQKISDRLYQFYHNRYYYKILKGLISFPTFLTIENKQYAKLKNKTKKVDRNLVHLVKMNKYQGQTTFYGFRTKTQPSSHDLNHTISYAKHILTEQNETSFNTNQTTLGIDFENPNKIQQTIQVDQQN